MASEVRFRPGESIFHEGDHSSLFYLLISGNVALEVSSPGRPVRVATLLRRRSTGLVVRYRRQRQAVSGAGTGRSPRAGLRRRAPAPRLRRGLRLRLLVHARDPESHVGAAARHPRATSRRVFAGGGGEMNIGVIRERGAFDRRVALTPPVVRRLCGAGHTRVGRDGRGRRRHVSAIPSTCAPARRSPIRRRKSSRRAELLAENRPAHGAETQLCAPGHGADGVLPHGRRPTGGCWIRWRNASHRDRVRDDPAGGRTPAGARGDQRDRRADDGADRRAPAALEFGRPRDPAGRDAGVPPARVVVLGAGAVGFAAARTAAAVGRAGDGVRSRSAQTAPHDGARTRRSKPAWPTRMRSPKRWRQPTS